MRLWCGNSYYIYTTWFFPTAMQTQTATEEVREAVKVGDVFYESWGYDQTNIDFAQVIRISPTGKTVLCRMMGSQRATPETVEPTEQFGVEFRLKIDHWIDNEGHDRRTYLRGSYPYCQQPNHPSENQRVSMRGPVSFSRYEGKPVYETPAGMGH